MTSLPLCVLITNACRWQAWVPFHESDASTELCCVQQTAVATIDTAKYESCYIQETGVGRVCALVALLLLHRTSQAISDTEAPFVTPADLLSSR